MNRDFLLVIGGRLATAILGLITIRVVTTYLSPEQYGQLALFLMVQTFCGLFLVNPIGQYINRNTHDWWEEKTLLSRLSVYKRYIFFVALVAAVSTLLVDRSFKETAELWWASGALALIVIAGTWNATLVPMLNMLGFRAASVLWAIASISVSLFASIFLMQWYPSAIAWLYGQAVGLFVGALGARLFLSRYAKKLEFSNSAENLIDKKSILSYCVPLAIAAGLMWVQLSGYRFLVEAYWGLAELGFVAVGFMLAGQVWGVAESLAMQFLYPYFFKRISSTQEDSGDAALSDLLNVLGPLYILFAGVTFLLSSALIYLLVDEKFSGALFFVEIGMFIECCRALGNVFGNAAQITKRTFSLTLPYGAGAVIVLLLLFLMGEKGMPVFWVGGALIVGIIMMLSTMIFMMWREVHFALDYKRWFGAVFVTLAMLIFGYGNTSSNLADIISVGSVAVVDGAFVAFLLLWRNPALDALIHVELVAKRRVG